MKPEFVKSKQRDGTVKVITPCHKQIVAPSDKAAARYIRYISTLLEN